jgi:hypothetical protein
VETALTATCGPHFQQQSARQSFQIASSHQRAAPAHVPNQSLWTDQLMVVNTRIVTGKNATLSNGFFGSKQWMQQGKGRVMSLFPQKTQTWSQTYNTKLISKTSTHGSNFTPPKRLQKTHHKHKCLRLHLGDGSHRHLWPLKQLLTS